MKDRWIYPLRRDPRRTELLALPKSYADRFPGRGYVEPKRWWKA